MLNKILQFLNLQDNSGNLSLTNLAVIAALIKMTLAPSTSLEDAGILFTVLANYAHKRFQNSAATEKLTTNENQLVTQLESLKSELEHVKSITSALSISAVFNKGKN